MQTTDTAEQNDRCRTDRQMQEYLQEINCIGCQRRCTLRYHLCSVGFLESAKAKRSFAQDHPLSNQIESVAAAAALHPSLLRRTPQTTGKPKDSKNQTHRCNGCANACKVTSPKCSYGGMIAVLYAKEYE